MKIKSITKIKLEKEVSVYDVINAFPYNNFLVRVGDSHIVSHNCAMIDEVNFKQGANVQMEKSKIMETYAGCLERMASRFMVGGKIAGKLFIVSSKKSEYDWLESYIRKKKDDPLVKVCDAKLWEVKPSGTYSGKTFRVAFGGSNMPSRIIEEDEDSEYYLMQGYEIIEPPIEFRPRFEMDMEKALMNIAGISISNVTKFITLEHLSKCYTELKNPFKSNIITLGMGDNLTIKDFFLPQLIPQEIYTKPLFIHFDCSLTGDRTGISCIAVLGYTNRQDFDYITDTTSDIRELCYRQVFTVGIQCPRGDEISFKKERDFVYYLRNELGWNIKGISLDSFQSADSKQQFITAGFSDTTIVSLDKTPNGYLCLKSAINERRIQVYDGQKELETELIRLEQDNMSGKLDHPIDGSKDLSDSLAGAVYNASLHDGQFAFHLIDDAELFADMNLSSEYDDRQNLLGSLISQPIPKREKEMSLSEALKQELEAMRDIGDGFLLF